MDEISVMTRTQQSEIPFLYGFCKHYLDYLLFDKIYFLCANDHNVISSNLPEEYKDKIKVLTLNRNIGDLNKCFIKFLKQIPSKYVLNVDCDEFLYLNGTNVEDYLEKNKGIDKFYFPWIMLPNSKQYANNYNELSESSNIFWGHVGKILFRNANVKDISCHNCKFSKTEKTKKYNKNQIGNYYCIFHFCARGFSDILLKMMNQNLKKQKRKESNINIINLLTENINTTKQIPNRVLMLMIQMNQNNIKDKKEIKEILSSIFNDSEIDITKIKEKIRNDLLRIKIKQDLIDEIIDGNKLDTIYINLMKKYWKPSYTKIKKDYHDTVQMIKRK